MKKIIVQVLTIFIFSSIVIFTQNEIDEADRIGKKLYREFIDALRSRDWVPNEDGGFTISFSNVNMEERLKFIDSVKQFFAEKVTNMFYETQLEEIKIDLALSYIDIIRDKDAFIHAFGQHLDFASLDFINPNVINFIFDSIPVNSSAWETRAVNYFWACLIAGETFDSPKFQKFLEANKGTDANALMYQQLFQYNMFEKNDTVTARKYLDLMTAELPDHDRTKRLNFSWDFNSTNKVKVGSIIPDFELADLDNENAMISMQSLRGKYVLIDLWGTWCPPCIKGIPHLEAAYEKYDATKLAIYSIARDKPENIKKFRSERHKMPWLNSIITTSVEDLLEVATYPTIFFISPTGEILVRYNGLMSGERFEQILKKHLQP